MDEATAAAPKRRGRPPGRKASMGAAELVRACVDLLREAPPARMTLVALARHAGVTPAMVNYYFADRAELMVAVATAIMDELAARRADSQADDPAERLKDLVEDLVEVHQQYPYLHDLLLTEVLSGATPAGRALFDRQAASAGGGFQDIIEAGVKKGLFAPIEPAHVMVTVIGAAAFFRTAGPLLSRTAKGADAMDPSVFAGNLARLVIEGLRSRPD